MANKNFTFAEFNRDFWKYYRDLQKEEIKRMEEEDKSFERDFDVQKITSKGGRARLSEI